MGPRAGVSTHVCIYDGELKPSLIDPLLECGHVLVLSLVALGCRMHGNDLQATAAQFLVHLLQVGSDIVAYVAAASIGGHHSGEVAGRGASGA